MLNLSGKTVLITGASRGIGEAAAKTFAQAGANVMLTARNADKLKNIIKTNKLEDFEHLKMEKQNKIKLTEII